MSGMEQRVAAALERKRIEMKIVLLEITYKSICISFVRVQIRSESSQAI